MKRITVIIIIVVMLVGLPAWAGTWKDNFGGDALGRWLKFDQVPMGAQWDGIDGELVATVSGDVKDLPGGGILFALPASGWVLPGQAPLEISETDDLAAEVKLKAGSASRLQLFRSLGMVIARKDNLRTFYTVSWSVTDESLNVGFLGAGGASHIQGIDPVPIQAGMWNWYKMRLNIRQRPFQVQVYWEDKLVKEFGFPMLGGGVLGGADKDFFPVGAVGLWAGGNFFRAYFDNFVMAWGDDVDDIDEVAKSLAVQPQSKLTTTWGKIKAGR